MRFIDKQADRQIIRQMYTQTNRERKHSQKHLERKKETVTVRWTLREKDTTKTCEKKIYIYYSFSLMRDGKLVQINNPLLNKFITFIK